MERKNIVNKHGLMIPWEGRLFLENKIDKYAVNNEKKVENIGVYEMVYRKYSEL